MGRPFTYTGRYPTTGGNAKFAPEMAVKVAEVMALRRAFDVAAPTAEERWDIPEAAAEVSRSAAAPSLAERAAAKRAEVETQGITAAPEAAGETLTEPTAEPSAPGLSRKDFLEGLEKAGISADIAAARSRTIFPGVDGKDLTDEQRAELLADLTNEQLVLAGL